jgi:hypothetical protein
MSARCPVCHAALDMQLEQVPEDGATCQSCGAQVQAFQRDDESVSMPSSKMRRRVLPPGPAYAEQPKARWVAKT